MNQQASELIQSSTHFEWMWQKNSDSWSASQLVEWSFYSDVENLIIEEAFKAKQSQAMLGSCRIDFERSVEICNNDDNKQRPVKRLACKRNDKHARKERFIPDPISPKRSFSGEYGWVSPFILAVRKDLKLDKGQLPSRDETIVPIIVEKAALGIIEEGKKAGKQHEAEYMAKQLMKEQKSGMKEVWKSCAHLYTMTSFLYHKLNEAMRLIGNEEHEQVWQTKIHTLGPFCLLLWDDPFSNKLSMGKLLYRGANLSDDQIDTYKDCSKRPNEYRTFQAFTSCSRNRTVAEAFSGNALFIMQVLFAFTMDLSPWSAYNDEEEELVIPGVGFTVQRVEFEKNTKKHLIYLQLRQRFSGEYEQFFHNLCELTSIVLKFPILIFFVIELSFSINK
jgi:hypothetical protein